MKEAPNNHSQPAAQFVIERVAGTGYCVTSSKGPECSILEKNAITVLGKIKQPNAEQEGVACEWIGPVGVEGYFVGVTTTLTTKGESRYNQFWFANQKRRHSIATYVIGVTISLVTGIALGAIGSKIVDAPANGPQRPQSPEHDSTSPPARGTVYDDLQTQIIATEEVRRKIEKYLQQEGLPADSSLPVIEEHRSVKIIADLDRSPPPRESIQLSNLEVLGLLKLLDRLNKLEADQRNTINDD